MYRLRTPPLRHNHHHHVYKEYVVSFPSDIHTITWPHESGVKLVAFFMKNSSFLGTHSKRILLQIFHLRNLSVQGV